MNLIERIDVLLLEARRQPGDFNARTFGQKKSPAFLKYREKIFSITQRKELESMLKTLEGLYRKGQLSMKELQDLTDKVLVKVQNIKKGVAAGKKVKGMANI